MYGFILNSGSRLAVTEPGSSELTVFRIRGPNGTTKSSSTLLVFLDNSP